MSITSASAGLGPGAGACATATAMYGVCASETPRFTELDFKVQASCLCYGWASSAAWEPSIFDQHLRTCSAYLSRASPAAYRSLSSQFDSFSIGSAPCQSVGNVGRASTTATYGADRLQSVASNFASASPGGSSVRSLAVGGASAVTPGVGTRSTVAVVTAPYSPGAPSGSGALPTQSGSTPQQTGSTGDGSIASAQAGFLAGILGLIAFFL